MMNLGSPNPNASDDSVALQKQIEQLTEAVETLKQNNQALQDKIHTLEGAVVPLYEDKITEYEQGHPIFKNYHALLVENFTNSVIEKIFESDRFVRRSFQSLRRDLLNFRGILTVLGVGTAGLVGLNTLVENTSKAVFENRIAAEYPDLIQRLERDRDTLMLLILDVSSQDRPNMQLLRSQGLDIGQVRESYLESNPNYREILADFLRGEENSTLFAGLLQKDNQNKAIQRYYALNYILQVPPAEDFKSALYDLLKDEEINPEQSSQTLSLDVYNQVLAAQALRRYQNQFDNLVNDVLLNKQYENLFRVHFWSGLINDLILTQIETTDLPRVKALLQIPVIQENQSRFASMMLVLYAVYPQLCEGDEGESCEAEAWLQQAKTLQSPRTEGDDNKAEITTATEADTCSKTLTADAYQALLAYRRDRTLPDDPAQIPALVDTLNCVLKLYIQNRQNFEFYQGSSLFLEDVTASKQNGISTLQRDLSALVWQEIAQGQLRQEWSAGSFINFYQDILYQSASETNSDLLYSGTEADLYSQLLNQSNYVYANWVLKELYERIENEPVTRSAFSNWLEEQGITEIDPTDSWIMISFLGAIASGDVWDSDSKRYVYVSLIQRSFNALQKGRGFDDYLSIMSSSYYSPEDWLSEVYPYFKDVWDDVLAYDKENYSASLGDRTAQTPVTGTNEEQDALWRWVDANKEQLEFKDGQWQRKS
jgi:hypothetical protein